MEINGVIFNASLEEILNELRTQLHINHIEYFTKDFKYLPRSIQVQCPYHGDGQERKPSAGFRRSDGKFHCFACNEIHELYEVISYCFGYRDDVLGKFGWNWLLKNFATITKEERKDVELDLVRDKSGRKFNNSSNTDINSGRHIEGTVSEVELDSYRVIHPYMYERKLTDEVIEIFDIGYDRDTECITFPIRDVSGRCLYVARRSVKTKYFNYPKDAEKPLYGLYELYQTSKQPEKEDIILCESMLDALTCWVYGKYALALNGLGSALQFEQLKRLPNRKIILATDNDEKGMEARQVIRRNVPNKLFKQYMFPEGRKDINELTQKEFENLIEIF